MQSAFRKRVLNSLETSERGTSSNIRIIACGHNRQNKVVSDTSLLCTAADDATASNEPETKRSYGPRLTSSPQRGHAESAIFGIVYHQNHWSSAKAPDSACSKSAGVGSTIRKTSKSIHLRENWHSDKMPLRAPFPFCATPCKSQVLDES